ncbi:hypothetical protein B0H10DRAFT_1941800 [Mycena sp. CBHHK59/15]|nr:hypothetical protein B0H10DRAFT_1941800 [Mycena sp. CBHHK59/15]
MLSVAISRDPSKIKGSNGFPSTLAPLSLIFNLVVAEFGRIKALHINGPHTNAELISDLLRQHSFPHLENLAVVLENHFMTIVHDGAPAVTTMENHPPIFLPLDLQSLLSLHLSNFPTIWPAAMPNGIRITELVLGKMSEFRPSLSELKQVWESAPLMERLGFYRQIAGLSLEDLLVDTSITLPSLTTLSLRHTPPMVERSFKRMEAIWTALASTNHLPGHQAYARQKAAMHRRRAEQAQGFIVLVGYPELLEDNASLVGRVELDCARESKVVADACLVSKLPLAAGIRVKYSKSSSSDPHAQSSVTNREIELFGVMMEAI